MRFFFVFVFLSFNANAYVCNNKSLVGQYVSNGYINKQINGKGYIYSASIIVFDGFGGFTKDETYTYNASVVSTSIRGDYKIHPNCTGFMRLIDANVTSVSYIKLSDIRFDNIARDAYGISANSTGLSGTSEMHRVKR